MQHIFERNDLRSHISLKDFYVESVKNISFINNKTSDSVSGKGISTDISPKYMQRLSKHMERCLVPLDIERKAKMTKAGYQELERLWRNSTLIHC